MFAWHRSLQDTPVARLLPTPSPRCYSMLPTVSLRAVRPSRAGMCTGLLARQLSTRSDTHVSAAFAHACTYD